MIRIINEFNLDNEIERIYGLLDKLSTTEELQELIKKTPHINTVIRIKDFLMEMSGRDLIVTFIDNDTGCKFKMAIDQGLWYLEQVRPYQHIVDGAIEEESGYEIFTIKNIKEFLLEEGIVIKEID